MKSREWIFILKKIWAALTDIAETMIITNTSIKETILINERRNQMINVKTLFHLVLWELGQLGFESSQVQQNL